MTFRLQGKLCDCATLKLRKEINQSTKHLKIYTLITNLGTMSILLLIVQLFMFLLLSCPQVTLVVTGKMNAIAYSHLCATLSPKLS